MQISYILKGRWPPDAKRQLTGKDPSAGKDWGQEEKGAKEDEMVGWLHWPNGYKFEQTPRGGKGQGSLACCSPWLCKESEMTQQLNWTKRVGRRQKELYLILKSFNHFPHPYSPPTFAFPLSFYCFSIIFFLRGYFSASLKILNLNEILWENPPVRPNEITTPKETCFDT